jgi:hypothetical protein
MHIAAVWILLIFIVVCNGNCCVQWHDAGAAAADGRGADPVRMVVMHWTAAWVLLAFMAACTSVVLVLLHMTRAGRVLHERIPDRPRRRLFLATVSFFVTFRGFGFWCSPSCTMLDRSDGWWWAGGTFTI